MARSYHAPQARSMLRRVGLRLIAVFVAAIGTAVATGASSAVAATCYANPIYAVSAANTNVYTIDPANGYATAMVGTDAFGSAAMARDPADGKLYYISFTQTAGTALNLSSWDPATGTVGPTVALTGIAAADVTFARAGFATNGTLYAQSINSETLYAINVTTGVATTLGTVGPNDSTGDLAFDPTNANQYYATYINTANNTVSLYRVTLSTLTATLVGQLGITTTTLYGVAFGNDGVLYALDNNGDLYSLSLTTGAATQVGTVTITNGGYDLGSLPAFQSSDAGITKVHTTTTVHPGQPIAYTLTVKNNAAAGNCTLAAVTVADALPATLTGPTYATSSGTYNSATGAWTGLALAPGASATITVTATVAPSATGTIVNTATVAEPAGFVDSNAANNASTDTATVVPLASVTKTVQNLSVTGETANTADNAKPGDTLKYVITFTNNSGAALTKFVMTDTVPANTSYLSATCGTVPNGLTCTPAQSGGAVTWTYSGTLPAGASGTFVLQVKVI